MPEEKLNTNSITASPISPGLLDTFDLSSPLREIYRTVLKSADVTPAEMLSFNDYNIEVDEMKIYLDLLVKLDYLEKFKEDGLIRYKVKARARGKSTLPDEIWKSLE